MLKDTKISKSLGNTIGLAELFKSCSPNQFRLLCLGTINHKNARAAPRMPEGFIFKHFYDNVQSITTFSIVPPFLRWIASKIWI